MVDDNKLGNEGASSIGQALERSGVSEVQMSNAWCLMVDNNQIGDEGVATLAKALEKNGSLLSLQLSNRPVNPQ